MRRDAAADRSSPAIDAAHARGRPAIVYLHGFRSAPASRKATELRAAVDAIAPGRRPILHVPDLWVGPRRAIERVTRLVAACQGASSITLVGSSLGGYYATHLAERLCTRAVLVNPAVRPYDDLEAYLGVQTNLYTGEPVEVTRDYFAELVALRVPRITRPERYFLLVESGDEVLPWRESVAFYGGAWQYVRGGGDHGFADFTAQLPAILRFAGVASD